MKKVKNAREMKVLIDKVMIPGYHYRTNYNCSDFLIDINSNLIIKAKLFKENDEMVYKFILDTQFIYEKEISYEELKMVINIIDIFENNKEFTLSKFKKYTVEEYEKEQEEAKIRSEKMLEAFQIMLEEHMKRKYENGYDDYYTKMGE